MSESTILGKGQLSPWEALAAQATKIQAEMQEAALASHRAEREEARQRLQALLCDTLGEELVQRLVIHYPVIKGSSSGSAPKAACTPFGIEAFFFAKEGERGGLVLTASPGGAHWTSSGITGEDTLALALEELKGRVERAREQNKVKARQKRFGELKEALKKATSIAKAKDLAVTTLRDFPAYAPTINGLLKEANERLLAIERKAKYVVDHRALQEALWTPFTVHRVTYSAAMGRMAWGTESLPDLPFLVTAEAFPKFEDWWEVLADAGEDHYGLPEHMEGIRMVRILCVATVEAIVIESWEDPKANLYCTHVEYPSKDSRVFSLLLPPKGASLNPCGPPAWHLSTPYYSSKAKEDQC